MGALPTTVVGLLVLLVAVLPGAVYTWAFERQAGSFGVTFADRSLRFVGASFVLHAVLAWGEYGVYRVAVLGRHELAAGQFAILWAGFGLLVAVPYGVGSVLGGLYRTRRARGDHWRWLRRYLSRTAEERLLRLALGHDPAPRAWDHLFADRESAYLRVRTPDGTWVAGRFADRSYAGGYPNPTDLLLEEAWEVDQDSGNLLIDGGRGYPVYLSAGQIAWLERVPEADGRRREERPG